MDSPQTIAAENVNLLMVGSSSSTYRLGHMVVKIPRIDDDAEITKGNMKAMKVEANVYKILGHNDLIANCFYVSPLGDLIILEFYENGNLKDYVAANGSTQLRKWTRQIVEAVEFVHSRGVRHSDIRLEQWLLDSAMNARLSDFNSSGYDSCPSLGLDCERALGLEDSSHFMPRELSADSSVQSDLFALGSTLYEIEQGNSPCAGEDQEDITIRFARQEFPSVLHLTLGSTILGLWRGKFNSASEILHSEGHILGS